MEKTEAVFDENNLGSPRSAEDKKIKTLIIKKIYGTTSKTEIENLKPEILAFLREDLENLFKELKESDNPIECIENFDNKNELKIFDDVA